LEYDEIQAVLGSIDRTTADGRRDYVLLAIMFNTGARVQEIVTLCVRDLQLEALPQVRLFGKGRKERWLGHASVATKNRYATVDLEMKRKAIEQARPTNFGSDGPAQWRANASILGWLEGL
jgi:site-specific recombinase XerC